VSSVQPVGFYPLYPLEKTLKPSLKTKVIEEEEEEEDEVKDPRL